MNQVRSENHNLFLGLLKSIVSQFDDNEKIINSFASTFKYKVTEGAKEGVHNVYIIRRRLSHWDSGQRNEIDNVLLNLSNYDGERVLIHSIWLDAYLFLFFTSIDANIILGYISSGCDVDKNSV